jgi:hypothetical protein
MIEPLPNCRSICAMAVSIAFSRSAMVSLLLLHLYLSLVHNRGLESASGQERELAAKYDHLFYSHL